VVASKKFENNPGEDLAGTSVTPPERERAGRVTRRKAKAVESATPE
jgi:hypothetical protein